MFVIANVFCDSGPLRKCFQTGLLFLGVGTLLALCVVPAFIALCSTRGRLSWYLKVYPFLLVLLGSFAMHWHKAFPTLGTRVAIMCAVMALLTRVYVFLSRSSKDHQDDAGERRCIWFGDLNPMLCTASRMSSGRSEPVR